MSTTSTTSFQGLSNDNTNINHISNDRKSDSTKYLHEHVDNHKIYPQRNNRAKLNYRDLERGMYGEIRQLMWTLDGSTLLNKNNIRSWNDKEEVEVIDLSVDDDDTDRRVSCMCQKPWDQSKLMLRCDLCANWYHGDCIGVTKEQAKTFEINADQFICPSCRGISHSVIKSTKSSDESSLTKRKHSDHTSPINNPKRKENGILSKSISHDESTKRLKTDDVFSQHDSLTESQKHCIVYNCNNRSKLGWIYCSRACIRRHINDTLQAIQQNKGANNEDIPTRDDILLYETKSKTILKKNLVPNIEDLCTWINQHPSYDIIKSSPRPPILLTKNQSTSSTRVNTNKIKLLSPPIVTTPRTNTKSSHNKKKPIQVEKQINNTIADIRSKVPTALYDKLVMRLEKNGEKHLINKNIQTIVDKIEQEMFHVYGKVDNSYKNKFRSLLANISNMNNNFFYKRILSKELTAQQIVAMKAEDMLPPEEKEKRKDQFEKEVQRIISAEEQTAEEMARRTRIKVTRQGLVDNDSILPMFKLKGQSSVGEKIEKAMDKRIETEQSISSSIDKTSKSIMDEKSLPKFESKTLPPTSLPKKIDSNESFKLLPPPRISEQSNCQADDPDNDYIEPESPTGVDALIYDDDDGLNDISTSSHSSTIHSPIDITEYNIPYQQIIRDDYNPSKTKNETPSISQPAPIIRLPNQWRGVIHPSDIKVPCQSVHVYGESDYLIGNIPEQLVILGRLRLGDLWDYIQESLAVRDVLILTLSGSSLNTNDNDIFLQYVDTMQASGRAAVISKCTNTSLIRDIYILAADTKDCSPGVLSSLFLPTIFETKQLFLVIIGSGKRTTKSIHRSHENQSLNNLIYKPIALQNSTVTRDPRLLKNKDPRLNKSNTTNENVVLSAVKPINNKQTSVKYTNEDLLKLISDSLERIRHSPTTDNIHSIVMSTTEILKSNRRDDLCTHFTDSFNNLMAERQATQRSASISTSTIITDDNLTEENMDVDDDHDDKHKKPVTPSSTSNISSEFNDTDYRFLDQDMHHPLTPPSTQNNDHRKQRRKSRFSDLLPTDKNRPAKLHSNISIHKIFPKDDQEKSTTIRADNIKLSSTKSINKHITTSLNSKFQPIMNSVESSTINIKDKFISKPIRFSFAKDPCRRHKPNSSSIFIGDFIEQVESYGYQDLSLSNDNRTKPITSIHSTTMLDLIVQQPKTKNRYSNEWLLSNNNNYNAHYHDLDQPQE